MSTILPEHTTERVARFSLRLAVVRNASQELLYRFRSAMALYNRPFLLSEVFLCRDRSGGWRSPQGFQAHPSAPINVFGFDRLPPPLLLAEWGSLLHE